MSDMELALKIYKALLQLSNKKKTNLIDMEKKYWDKISLRKLYK